MNELDSLEVTELRKLIDNKKEYLPQIDDGKRYFYLQREINLLENKIMPILLGNSVPVHCEIAKEAVACFDKLLNEPDAKEYNGMVLKKQEKRFRLAQPLQARCTRKLKVDFIPMNLILSLL